MGLLSPKNKKTPDENSNWCFLTATKNIIRQLNENIWSRNNVIIFCE